MIEQHDSHYRRVLVDRPEENIICIIGKALN